MLSATRAPRVSREGTRLSLFLLLLRRSYFNWGKRNAEHHGVFEIRKSPGNIYWQFSSVKGMESSTDTAYETFSQTGQRGGNVMWRRKANPQQVYLLHHYRFVRLVAGAFLPLRRGMVLPT